MATDQNIYSKERTTSDGLSAPTANADLPCCDDDQVGADEQLPQRAVDALEAAAAELSQAERGCAEVMEDLFDSVAAELGAAEALINSFADEQVGATDLLLSDAETRAVKVLAQIVQAADRELEQCVQWLLDVEIKPPYHPAEMVSFLQGDWLAMLTAAIPAVGLSLLQQSNPITDYAPPEEETGGGGDYGTTPAVYQPAPMPVATAPVTTTTTTTSGGDDITVNVYLPAPPPPEVVVVAPPAAAPPVVGSVLYPGGIQTGLSPYSVGPRYEVGPDGQLVQVPPDRVTPDGRVIPRGGDAQPPLKMGSSLNQPYPGEFGQPAPIPGTLQINPPGAGSKLFDPATQTIDPSAKLTGALSPVDLHYPTLGGQQPASAVNAVNWNDLAACKHAASLATAPAQNFAAGKQAANEPTKSTFERYAAGKLQWKNWGSLLFPMLAIPLELKQLADSYAKSDAAKTDAVEVVVSLIGQETILGNLGANAVPNKAAATYFGAKLAAARWAEGKTNFPLEYLMTSDRYLFQYANPQELPNQVRVDDAYLAGAIPLGVWECWTKANGNLPDPAKRVMEGNQTKPELGDLITLFRRGHMTYPDLVKRARDRGVIEPAYIPEYLAVTTALPTMSDLVSFMVRDAADDKVAALYGYDTDFTEKYTPQIQAWAKSLGLDETYFRYAWRAHWEIPSYTQLSEMFHRLRPGREELKEWDEQASIIGKDAQELIAGPRPRVVTRDDVKEALEINDYAPAWVPAMIDIAYTPITRTDAVRAYMIGEFNDAELQAAFLDVGYSPRDAARLLKYHAQDRARRRSNVTGTWSIRKITKYYKLGYISREKASELMSPLTADKAEVDSTLNAADDELAADTRAAAVRGVKRGIMSGEHSAAEAVGLLTRFGVGPTVADRMLTSWIIERDTRYKRLSAAQATAMLKDGLIGAEEFRKRIRNLGYGIRDADLITARALKVEGTADGLTPDALDKSIGEAVRSRKNARLLSDKTLTGRLRQLLAEAGRIQAELDGRGPPPVLPPDREDDGGG